MQRLKDYARFIAWSSGLGYMALWALTFWTLNYGGAVFGRSGVCRPLSAQVLFYWSCDPGSALSFLASLINTALTITVWAPVYIAAATALPEAVPIAVPIVAAHVVGLPAALFVTIRSMSATFAFVRRISSRRAAPDATRASAN